MAHMGSRETGLVQNAALLVVGMKGQRDHHQVMCSGVSRNWLTESVLPRISGEVLVVDRTPYHLVRTPDSTPVGYKLRRAELAQWLVLHDVVPGEAGWQQSRTKAEMKATADANKPAPRFLVQELAATFGASVLFSPVAHPDLNPIETVWGTVKRALKRGTVSFTLTTRKELMAKEFDKITPQAWAKHEHHVIKKDDSYRDLDAERDAVEVVLEGRERELACVEADDLTSNS